MATIDNTPLQARYIPSGFFSPLEFNDDNVRYFSTREQANALMEEISKPLPERIVGSNGFTQLSDRELKIQAMRLWESGQYGKILYAPTEHRRPYEIYGSVEVHTEEGLRFLTFAENVGVHLRQKVMVQGDSPKPGRWSLAIWPVYGIATLHWWRPGAGVW